MPDPPRHRHADAQPRSQPPKDLRRGPLGKPLPYHSANSPGTALPGEDSNPDLLIQSQVCCQLHHPALRGGTRKPPWRGRSPVGGQAFRPVYRMEGTAWLRWEPEERWYDCRPLISRSSPLRRCWVLMHLLCARAASRATGFPGGFGEAPATGEVRKDQIPWIRYGRSVWAARGSLTGDTAFPVREPSGSPEGMAASAGKLSRFLRPNRRPARR